MKNRFRRFLRFFKAAETVEVDKAHEPNFGLDEAIALESFRE